MRLFEQWGDVVANFIRWGAVAVLLILGAMDDAEPEREFSIRIQGLAGDGPAAGAPAGVVPIGPVMPIPGGAE